MKDNLFANLDRNNDYLWVAKEFFNSINGERFVKAVKYISNGTGYGDEFSDCEFPDGNSGGEQFVGVKFRYHDDEIVVSTEDFNNCLIDACKKFIVCHPEVSGELLSIVKKLGH